MRRPLAGTLLPSTLWFTNTLVTRLPLTLGPSDITWRSSPRLFNGLTLDLTCQIFSDLGDFELCMAWVHDSCTDGTAAFRILITRMFFVQMSKIKERFHKVSFFLCL